MRLRFLSPSGLLGLLLLAVASLAASVHAVAADLKGGRLRVAILADMTNFDPQQFSTVNFPLIKNLYDSLLEYAPDGKAVPSLASSWEIASDNRSVTVKLRTDVKFHSGAPFNADAVAATLKKSADPQKGKNVYATMSFVKDWTIVDPHTIRLNFNGPAPERQVTDLLQFLAIIDPAGIDTVEQKPAGTGAYTLGERVVGQRIVLKANPNYWREKQPVSEEVVLTIFSDDAAATAALESGAVDLIYGGTSRSAVRLKSAGYQLIQGPGPAGSGLPHQLHPRPVQERQVPPGLQPLMDRQGILRVGYAGLGEVVALPGRRRARLRQVLQRKYAFNIDKAKALLAESGLPQAR
jgi:ABC-type transport system substrate-binding protein